MVNDINNFIRTCPRCQRAKSVNLQKAHSKLKNVHVPNRIWTQIGIDLMGTLTEIDGYRYVLTVIDYFTKWVEIIPLKTKSGEEVGRALFKTFTRYGCPKVIISDQGREFCNALNTKLFKLTGVDHRVTSAYHPQANGMVEKQNSATTSALKACIDEQEDWLDCLDSIAMSFRGSQHCSTGKTPFEMMFGTQMRLPIELKTTPYVPNSDEEEDCDDDQEENLPPPPTLSQIFDAMKEVRDHVHNAASINISKAQAKQAKNYDLRHRGVFLEVGDKVMRINAKQMARKGNKLAPKWLGPYTIVAVHKNGNYSVADKNGKVLATKVCASQVKKYYENPDEVSTLDLPLAPPNSENSDTSEKDYPTGLFVDTPIKATRVSINKSKVPNSDDIPFDPLNILKEDSHCSADLNMCKYFDFRFFSI